MFRAGVLAAALLASSMARAEKCPNMLIVLDRSFSMSQSGKWNAATQAIAAFTPNRDSVMRFGLMVFPAVGTTCGGGESLVNCDFFATEPITAALALQYPGGWTPTAAAIASAAKRPDMTDAARKRFVILITDGDPQCPGTPNPDEALVPAVQQVQNLALAGVKTFVIGFGSGVTPARLDQLAEAGGEARVGGTCKDPAGAAGTIPCKYYEASDQASLRSAFDQIATVASGELQGSTCDDSCYTGTPCPTGQICVSDVHTYQTLPPYVLNAGKCVTDPCAGVACAGTQFCRAGKCVASCTNSCAAGQICQDGACIADPCAGDPTLCTCAQTCPQNQVCLNGKCQDDPCRYIHCPADAPFCSQGSCFSGPPAPRGGEPSGPGTGGTGSGGGSGGGGCSCDSSGAALLLPGLALLPWALRRRRAALSGR